MKEAFIYSKHWNYTRGISSSFFSGWQLLWLETKAYYH